MLTSDISGGDGAISAPGARGAALLFALTFDVPKIIHPRSMIAEALDSRVAGAMFGGRSQAQRCDRRAKDCQPGMRRD